MMNIETAEVNIQKRVEEVSLYKIEKQAKRTK